MRSLSAAQQPVTLPPYVNDATSGYEKLFRNAFCSVMPRFLKKDRFSLQKQNVSREYSVAVESLFFNKTIKSCKNFFMS